MRKSGYRTTFHIYLIFLAALLVTAAAAIGLSCSLITLQKPGGGAVRSDWPAAFGEAFKEQVIPQGEGFRVTSSGLELLQKNQIGLQILDAGGKESASFRKPAKAQEAYTQAELLQIDRSGALEQSDTAVYVGTAGSGEKTCMYLLHFPLKVEKITMYVNKDRFYGGKVMVLASAGILFAAVLVAGLLYGLKTAGSMRHLAGCIRDISDRRYLPVQKRGTYRDLYESLNAMYGELLESDRLREETADRQRAWIAGITHDLKTPLSPIRGYAEMLAEEGEKAGKDCRRYAKVMLQNVDRMESLMDDLKVIYQLESGILPMDFREQNLVRFLRELVICLLNDPKYQDRTIHFVSTEEELPVSFDQKLLERAVLNLMVNAFVHGDPETELTLKVSAGEDSLEIAVSDNGRGMTDEEAARVFDRYVRGRDRDQSPEGTGLGLAIAKEIAELHRGTIEAFGIPGTGTTFLIRLPFS